MKLKFAFAAAGLFLWQSLSAQIIDPTPTYTIKGLKDRVTCVKISPKGDMVLAGFGQYAALYDIEKGKKVAVFEHEYNRISAIYAVYFDDDGDRVCTVDMKGKRRFWDAYSGKLMTPSASTEFGPDPRAVTALGLGTKNSENNYYYTQREVDLPNLKMKAKSVRGGSIQIINNENEKVVQEIKFEKNKDRFHEPPCYVSSDDAWFVTGTDAGEILLYKLN